MELAKEIQYYEEIKANLEKNKIKPMSNEEIKKKRMQINKKLTLIFELIQEGRFLDAEREAKDIIKIKKSFKSFKSNNQNVTPNQD